MEVTLRRLSPARWLSIVCVRVRGSAQASWCSVCYVNPSKGSIAITNTRSQRWGHLWPCTLLTDSQIIIALTATQDPAHTHTCTHTHTHTYTHTLNTQQANMGVPQCVFLIIDSWRNHSGFLWETMLPHWRLTVNDWHLLWMHWLRPPGGACKVKPSTLPHPYLPTRLFACLCPSGEKLDVRCLGN